MASALLFVGVAGAQYPMLDMIADKVDAEVPQAIDLRAVVAQEKAQEKGQPKPAMEQEAIRMSAEQIRR